MSKHLLEVFANRFQVHLLETIQPEPCEELSIMDILIEEVNEDGSPRCESFMRHVKVCHSQKECTHYEVMIDETSGIGKITLQGIHAQKLRIVEVDEEGRQMISGDHYDISYTIDEETMEEDYGEVVFEEGKQQKTVRIINRVQPKATLHLEKSLRDRENNECPLQESMEFLVRICQNNGFERFVKLNNANSFSCVVEDLNAGFYTIEEYDYCDYEAYYQMNDNALTSSTQFVLNPSHNELEIINVERRNTQLTITKYVKDACGEFNKPSCFEEFEVRIISDDQEECILLSEENDFCATLYGLTPGFYDVREIIKESSLYDTSYIVNDTEETQSATLEICEDECNEVWIINQFHEEQQACCQDAPLRICKYIRKSDGCLKKPSSNLQFKVELCGCGIREAFYLNAHNNFCVDRLDLCHGEYEVREVCDHDFLTSYVINEGCETSSACICYDGSENFCVSIINEERNSGTLLIQKYIRNEFNDLIRPKDCEHFFGSLNSFCDHRCFELNKENDFSVCFTDLSFASYEIREDPTCEYCTSYQIDCEKECPNARLIIDNDCDHEVKIINQMEVENCGVLKIKKMIETRCKELVKPMRDEEFEVRVYSDCFNECYTLKASNQWCIQLEGLQEGEYRVEEVDSTCYHSIYQVNKTIVDEAIVCMGDCDQEVCIINQTPRNGNLIINALVRDCDGCERMPSISQSIEVLIEGKEDSMQVCLNAQNNWCVEIEDLCAAKYRIFQKDNFGYKVSYVHQGRESSFGKVNLGSQDEEMTIINEESTCVGNVIVTKYWMEEDGSLRMPQQGEEYHFALRSSCFSHTYTLRKRNDFCLYFDDLEENEYELCELDEGYEVCYRINGEVVEQVKFCLGSEDVHIDILNSCPKKGTLRIEKWIKQGSTLCKPQDCDVYQVLLKGKNVHEIFELNANNDFCIQVMDLLNQHYEVKELETENKVSYEVDGVVQEDGYILFDGEDIHMNILNEELFYGCMEIKKVIENENGQWCTPNRYEKFMVMVESDCFKQKVCLNKDNDFCVQLCDLAQGHYEIHEVDNCGCVRYLINDLPCESACVDIAHDDVCITIINQTCAKGNLHFSGQVEEDGCIRELSEKECLPLTITCESESQEIVLMGCKQSAQSICGLFPNKYTLCSKEQVRFVIEDQSFDREVCIALNGEDVCIQVLLQKERKNMVSIKKCLLDTHGNRSTPSMEESFDVCVCHELEKQCFSLNYQNQFQCVIDNLSCGTYEIKEVGQEDVKMSIDGGCIQANAPFELNKDMEIVLFNPCSTSAWLHLESRIQTCDGHLIVPNDEDCFQLCVHGEDSNETIFLNAGNAWQAKLCLKEGTYHVEQKVCEGYESVCYLLNDQRVEQASVEMNEEDQFVSALNCEYYAFGSIEICKLIRDEEGCYCYPNTMESYSVLIRGEKEEKRICLNAENHFYACLRNLSEGRYEVIEEDGRDVEYVVNNATGTKQGIVHVCQNANTVNIINNSQTKGNGNITLAKYIRQGNDLKRPNPQDAYVFLLTSMGFHQLYTLDVNNGWMMKITNLKDGEYTISETTNTNKVTYIINGASEVDYGVIHVTGNSNTVQIINEQAVSGTLTLQKYMRETNGELVTPNNQQSFRMHISSPGYQKVVTLDSSNHYTQTLYDLKEGYYVVNEIDSINKVSYIIDQGSEVDRAIVHVQNMDHHVDIINQAPKETKGSVHIEKYVREGMKLRRPPQSFHTQVFLSKPGYQKVFTLDETNEWTVELNDLENGLYVLDEVGYQNEVSYIINGGSEVHNGVIRVEDDVNMVMMINTIPTNKASLQLNKWIRKEDGSYQVPDDSQSFLVEVRKDHQVLPQVLLNAQNHFNVVLDNLANGEYEVEEVSNQGYMVRYRIDQGRESATARIRIFNDSHIVDILNSTQENRGSLTLNKVIKNGDGSVMLPADGDEFIIQITNDSTKQRVSLNSGNHFTMTLQDLPVGEYRIVEVESFQYLTTYRINGGEEVNIAYVQVEENTRQQVEVINELLGNRNTIEVFKYMLDNDGNYLPPTAPDSYHFTIKGLDNGITQSYELNVDNSWHQRITTLPNGRYQVSENGTSPYPIKYLINSADLRDEAIFTASAGTTQVIGIINTMENDGLGQMTLTKRIKDFNGNLSMPQSGEVFTINVSSATNNQIVTLQPDNDYTFNMEELPFGIYTIEEVSNGEYQVSYRINEGIETNHGVVNVDSSAMNAVLIINTANANSTLASTAKNSIKVVLE